MIEIMNEILYCDSLLMCLSLMITCLIHIRNSSASDCRGIDADALGQQRIHISDHHRSVNVDIHQLFSRLAQLMTAGASGLLNKLL